VSSGGGGGKEKGRKREIEKIYPDSLVCTKTFHPNWADAAGDETGMGAAIVGNQPRYLVLTFEAFQQEDSDFGIRSLLESERIDLVIVDEVHFAKQRSSENLTLRRQRINALISEAKKTNPEIHTLVMSATPVINNLREGKSMVELLTGVAHDDLKTLATVPNCMRVHQRLVTHGIRWMPDYQTKYEQIEIPVDYGSSVEENSGGIGFFGRPRVLVTNNSGHH